MIHFGGMPHRVMQADACGVRFLELDAIFYCSRSYVVSVKNDRMWTSCPVLQKYDPANPTGLINVRL